MAWKRLARILIAGVITVVFYSQAGRVAGQSQTPVSPGQKPYHPHDFQPVIFDPEQQIEIEAPKSPLDVPDYRKFQNYVYQIWVPGIPTSHGSHWDIFFRSGFGTAVNITNANAQDIDLDLNGSGTSIVFSSERSGAYDIYSMNTAGGSLARLTTHAALEYSPRWSPDSKRIAYVSEAEGKPKIFIMNANGSGQTRLTISPVLGDYYPSFSPDGAQIAYNHQDDLSGGSIWVMNANGTNQHQVSPYVRYLQHPAWSPDGTLIAFDGDLDGDEWNEMATVRTNGSEMQEIFDFNESAVDAWMSNWSSDSEHIIFTRASFGIDYENGQYYLSGTRVYLFSLSSGVATMDSDLADTSNADWFRSDAQSPITSLKPLPKYSGPDIVLDWNYKDIGISGLYRIQLQYKYELDGTWTDVTESLVEAPPYSFRPSMCGMYYFRARGEDHAENWEEWPATDFEAYTKHYINVISGNITDNRGVPLPSASISFSPEPLEPIAIDPFGNFNGYLCNINPQNIYVSHPGFGNWNRHTFSVVNPTLLTNYYLPPQTSIIQNGEFIFPITQWINGGDMSAQATELPYAKSMRFGGAVPITPTEETIYDLDIIPQRPLLRIDLEGGRHAIWNDGNSMTPTIYYAYKPSGGSWTIPLAISNPADRPIASPDMDIDGTGNLHVVWIKNLYISGHYYDHVMYRIRNMSGTWTTELDISDALQTDTYEDRTFPEVILDPSGRAHFVWVTNRGIGYRSRGVDGTWDGKITIDTGCINTFSATVGPDGTVYVMYRKEGSPYGTYFTMKSAGGSWTAPMLMSTYPARVFERDSLAVQADGKLLWVGYDTDHIKSILYQELDSTGTWGPLQSIDAPIQYPPVFVKLDSMKRPYLFILKGTFLIANKASDGQWNYAVAVNHAVNDCIFNDIDIPECTFRLKTFRVEIPSTVSTTVSQNVTIPADLKNATLAFNYSFTRPEGSGDFRVRLGGDEIFSTPPNDQMALGSVNVNAWKGQTVPLSFETDFVPLDGKFEVYLYNVSLGDWTTPSITALSPGSFTEFWDDQAITVTGQNFVDPVSVKLDDFDVPGVVFVDSSTLQLTLPPGLPFGFYTLKVTNPSGQEAIRFNALRLGLAFFLPTIMK